MKTRGSEYMNTFPCKNALIQTKGNGFDEQWIQVIQVIGRHLAISRYLSDLANEDLICLDLLFSM